MVAVNEKSYIFAISFICRVKSVELIMASLRQSGSFYIKETPDLFQIIALKNQLKKLQGNIFITYFCKKRNNVI